MNEFGELDGGPGEKEFLAGALLGEGLPPEAEEYLELASQSYADSETAERYLMQARQWAPDHAAVLIGLYRFYFYKGRIPPGARDRQYLPREGRSRERFAARLAKGRGRRRRLRRL